MHCALIMFCKTMRTCLYMDELGLFNLCCMNENCIKTSFIFQLTSTHNLIQNLKILFKCVLHLKTTKHDSTNTDNQPPLTADSFGAVAPSSGTVVYDPGWIIDFHSLLHIIFCFQTHLSDLIDVFSPDLVIQDPSVHLLNGLCLHIDAILSAVGQRILKHAVTECIH